MALEQTNDTGSYGTMVDILKQNPDLFLDAVDFLLSNEELMRDGTRPHSAVSLESLLDESGSAWRVGQYSTGHLRLERRIDETTTDAAIETMLPTDRASEHLRGAWDLLYGRFPSPSEGYREAVRAVESIAKPVILPMNPKATLGQMVPAFRDKPQKWSVVLSETDKTTSPHDVVAGMMAMLWASQHDRHGTDDESVPLNVTLEAARAALHLSLTLVHWFRTGAIATV